MIKTIVILTSLHFYLHGSAQPNTPGIYFEQNLTWEEAQAKALRGNKYIFIDAGTRSCSPCVYMDKKVFPAADVGRFFNEHFINVKVQLDTTSQDDAETKNWYAAAARIKRDFKIVYLPTFIFLSPQGAPLHLGVGGSDAASFIALGKEALDTGYQFFTLKRKYEAGSRDSTLLYHLAKAANRAADDALAKRVTKDYILGLEVIFTKDNFVLLRSNINHPADFGFTFFLNNTKEVDKLLGAGESGQFVSQTLKNSVLYPFLYSHNKPIKHPAWEKVRKVLTTALPSTSTEQLEKILGLIKKSYSVDSEHH